MSNIAIKVENLSKLYQLGEVGTGTISKDLNRWWARVRGKEDPYAKIGQANDRTKKAESDFVWALKDINFEVMQGEVLGIIGRNGAGKSTLLKILSKITSPTAGKIYTKGRIASLLEVGTGFHPEMTGRENIYLNGAILGMRKWEIDKKFDEIVDFAGVEAYIDTPVKRYSSGMYVRLAFAVAAFLEPEILIVDEVLAVGDAEFQTKCLGRMKDVSVNEGRTVLFVSHNLAAIKNLVSSALLISNGENQPKSEVNFVIENYISKIYKSLKNVEFYKFGDFKFSFKIMNQFNNSLDFILNINDVYFKYFITSSRIIKNFRIVLAVFDTMNQRVIDFDNLYQSLEVPVLNYEGEITIHWKKVSLKSGTYILSTSFYEGENILCYFDSFKMINILENNFFGTGKEPNLGQSSVLPDVQWNFRL